MLKIKQKIITYIIIIMLSLPFFVIIDNASAITSTVYTGTNVTVTDPIVDQICDTRVAGLKSIIVSQWDGITWTNVPAVNISYSGTVVTVDHGVLVGG